MLPLYQKLIDPEQLYVAEKKEKYISLTERHLQAMWLEQKYMRSLISSEGEKIIVISPGLWNTEAGPDFLKAHIKIGDREIKGDIEIHLNDASWYSHRHHEDERYDQVVLHVSYWLPETKKPITKSSGKQAFATHLENHLTIPLARLVQLIDLDLYPYKRFTGSGQCSQSLFKTLSEDKIGNLLAAAAYWRCDKKVDYLQSRFPERPLQLAGGVAMALGYKHNAEAFIELFTVLLPFRDLSEQELLAVALGCSGFFEERFNKWESSNYYQQLRSLWWGKKDLIDYQAYLRLDHIRPLNHPVRRLAYLAKFLQDPLMEDLWFNLAKIWCDFVVLDLSTKGIKVIKQQMLDLIPDYQDVYWNSHFLFENGERPFIPFIGKDTKTEIVINVFVPLLYQFVRESGNPKWWEAFQVFYGSFKGVTTSKSRYLQHRFFGNGLKASILDTAQMTQGAYQIHRDFCLHYEASCEGCPFVKRYLEQV